MLCEDQCFGNQHAEGSGCAGARSSRWSSTGQAVPEGNHGEKETPQPTSRACSGCAAEALAGGLLVPSRYLCSWQHAVISRVPLGTSLGKLVTEKGKTAATASAPCLGPSAGRLQRLVGGSLGPTPGPFAAAQREVAALGQELALARGWVAERGSQGMTSAERQRAAWQPRHAAEQPLLGQNFLVAGGAAARQGKFLYPNEPSTRLLMAWDFWGGISFRFCLFKIRLEYAMVQIMRFGRTKRKEASATGFFRLAP